MKVGSHTIDTFEIQPGSLVGPHRVASRSIEPIILSPRNRERVAAFVLFRIGNARTKPLESANHSTFGKVNDTARRWITVRNWSVRPGGGFAGSQIGAHGSAGCS